MNKKSVLALSTVILAAWATSLPGLCAETEAAEFKGKPDKNMAAAHEAFMKGDMKTAAKQIAKAADFVKKQSEKMGQGCKEGVKKAGDDLAKVGEGVKKGTVKSGDELKKAFASTDHALAKGWHATAEEAKKSGKDTSIALKRAGAGLDGAARWSGHQLSEGAKASVKAAKQAGKGTAKGVEKGADKVDKWFKDIGEGIKDLGHKL